MIISNMLFYCFRGSPIRPARVYCKSRPVCCALALCDHISCMLKKENKEKFSLKKEDKEPFLIKIRTTSNLVQNFIPKIEKVKVAKFGNFGSKLIKFGKCLGTNERTNSQSMSVNSHDNINGIISLNRSESNWSISPVFIRLLSVLTRSEIISRTNDSPSDTSLTAQSDTPPSAGTRESQQHPRWGSQPRLRWGHTSLAISLPLCSSTSHALNTSFPLVPECLGISNCSWGYISAGSALMVSVTYSGDSNSPMPSPVGGILDTPIVTFLSRIPEDLSLWISSATTSLAVSARRPGLRVDVEHSALWSHSEIFHHDELSTEVVIDRLFVHELTCLKQIEMFISYHAMLFLICQVQLRHNQERRQVKC